jgi:CRP-like cAMP-binding protein
MSAAVELSLMEVIIALRGIPLFAAVHGEGLRRLADAVRQRVLRREEWVFAEGEAGEELFFVHRGSIEIVQRVGAGENILEVVGPGEHFGEVALLDELPRAGSARALEDSLLLSIGRGRMREAVLDHPDIAFAMMTALSRRLRAAFDRVRAISERSPTG